MRRAAQSALLVCGFLCGCGQNTVLKPGPVVPVPVAEHCRHAPLIKPLFPLASLPQSANTAELLRACLQTDRLRQAYEFECEAIVAACE